MKRIISICAMMLGLILVLSGCSQKYRRIDLGGGETLGEELEKYINKDTSVVNKSEENFPDQLPIYKISKRSISEKESEKTLQQLGINSPRYVDLEENTISVMIKSSVDDLKEFNMSDEALEKLAWETFNKLSLMKGTYKYFGITATYTTSDSNGSRIDRVGVSFRRMLDDIRIIGEDRCELYFDGTGALVEFYIKLYNYEKIGTMDLVTSENAFSKIKKPDAFKIYTEPSEPELGMLDTLHVEKTNLLLVNQYSNGCTILQPIYSYIGTATDVNGKQEKFNSKVIAIPESYTYVEKSEQ